jgi:hypothetical protein
MNGEDYTALSEVMRDKYDYLVEPEPIPGESVRFFDVVSYEGEIATAKLLNTVHETVQQRQLSVAAEVVASRSHRVTFEDVAALNV